MQWPTEQRQVVVTSLSYPFLTLFLSLSIVLLVPCSSSFRYGEFLMNSILKVLLRSNIIGFF